jgi:NodT family efflux transporter outer membrane factor (OMF) lipoprotein
MMKRSLKILSLSALLALIASGCTTVGPDYQVPTAPVQTDWLEYEDPLLDTTPPVAPEWWKAAFNDSTLDQLVETALEQNLTLRSAGLRVLQAQQNLAIAVGNQYPQQQQFSGSAEGKRLAPNSSDHNPQLENTFGLYNLGFSLTWEANVWGRFTRLIESASAELDASVAGYDGVLISLVAQIAQTYILIRATQVRIEITRKNIDQQAQSVEITRAKFDAGEVSALDLDQAETLLNNTKAQVPGLETSLQQLKNSLAVLLGRPPHDMSALLGEKGPIPSAPLEIALGMPQDLIRRRPDIRVAERQLAAQSAQIGYAVSDLYPHFTLGGSIATSTSSIASKNVLDLFDVDSVGFNLFGAFQWNIFQYGRLKSNIRLQDALFQQLLVDYRNTVLQAQGEVENAIVAYLKSHEQAISYGLAAEASQRAVEVSTIQYQEGAVNFNTVITTLKSNLQQQDQLASTQGSVGTNLVAVYKSLGGGWEVLRGRDSRDLIPDETKKEMLRRTKYWKIFFNRE